MVIYVLNDYVFTIDGIDTVDPVIEGLCDFVIVVKDGIFAIAPENAIAFSMKDAVDYINYINEGKENKAPITHGAVKVIYLSPFFTMRNFIKSLQSLK